MANKDEDLVEIQVDSELLDQVKALIAPLGLSPEELVVRFMEYCANPETQGEAMANLRRWQGEIKPVQKRNRSIIPRLPKAERMWDNRRKWDK